MKQVPVGVFNSYQKKIVDRHITWTLCTNLGQLVWEGYNNAEWWNTTSVLDTWRNKTVGDLVYRLNPNSWQVSYYKTQPNTLTPTL